MEPNQNGARVISSSTYGIQKDKIKPRLMQITEVEFNDFNKSCYFCHYAIILVLVYLDEIINTKTSKMKFHEKAIYIVSKYFPKYNLCTTK